MFGTIECSIQWPELDQYWAGTYKDLTPLFRTRYEEENINFVGRSWSWLGGTGHGWLCHFILFMFRTIECSINWPELD